MNTNTNTAGRAKGAKATTNTNTTKATKANTTTKAAKMDAAAVVSAAAALILKYKTIAGIKTAAASLREKYGASNWEAILKEAKAIRARAVEEAAKAAKAGVFTYRVVLGAMFKELAKDANFRKLCAIAKAEYKATDTDAAARLVAEYYTAVDANGAPLSRVEFYAERSGLIYSAYVLKELTDKAALDILKAALAGLAKASRTATRKAEDATRAALDNTKEAGVIFAVSEAKEEAGVISRGQVLAGAGAPKEAPKEYARAAKSAAALIGRAVPEEAARLAEINAAARAKEAEAARAALARERAALKADAKAAGVKTAPKGRKEAARAAKDTAKAKAAAASMARIDAAIRANNAEAAPALNA